MDRYRSQVASPVTGGVSERDAIIITYADQIRESGVPPLRTLVEFSSKWMQGVVSGIHMLPFYPASSDDGFSVIDYKSVDPALGDWEDIHTLRKSFRLMFDAVINHVSSQSDWFQDFLQDRIPYRDYFITVEGGVDLSQVVRPRALPLLTSFNTISGNKSVWTTFSSDQIDLDFRNPRVLLEIMEVLLFYISQGAEFIRLDAIAYLWKEIGSSCIHLPQTHHLVQLIRAVLDDLAPHVQLITETNVPHAENISYFGDGSNEAQMVYNFALPPLVLHTFLTGNAAGITRWAAKLELPSSHVTFFNFLASHDGIGITPANGLISPAEIDALVEQAQAHGGLVSFRTNPDGSQSPYELNINYFDALSDPEGEESLSTQIDRFLAAHALMLSLVGVPGIYFHSLFGSRSWREGVTQTGRYRTINRQKLHLPDLESELGSAGSRRAVVYQRLAHMLRSRAAHPAFHPYGLQNVMELDARLFAILRTSTDHRSHVLCLINVSGQSISVELPLDLFPFNINPYPLDLIRGRRIQLDRSNRLSLMPYQVFWLMPPKY
jgi:sucrose phosphorylase